MKEERENMGVKEGVKIEAIEVKDSKAIIKFCNGEVKIEITHEGGKWVTRLYHKGKMVGAPIGSSTPPWIYGSPRRDSELIGLIGKILNCKHDEAKQICKKIIASLDQVKEKLSADESTATESPEALRRQYFYTIRPYLREGLDVLKRGKPLEYFVKAMSIFHRGDDTIKIVLVLSAFTPYTQPPNEKIHVTITGSSGKGKSELATIALLCFPEYVVESWIGCSPMYPYYRCKDNPGALADKILYIDDSSLIDISFLRSIKTPDLNGRAHYGTVVEQSPFDIILEGTPVVWQSMVNPPENVEDRSRSIIVKIDESKEQDEMVMKFILEKECKGETKSEEIPKEFMVCRAIYWILSYQRRRVVIPEEIKNSIPKTRDRRRLKRFIGFIRASAFINQFQRKRDNNTIYANKEDLEIALKIYAHTFLFDAYGLDADSLKILNSLLDEPTLEIGYDEIAKWIKKSRVTAYNKVQGLCEKGLVYIERINGKDCPYLSEEGKKIVKMLRK